MSKLDAQRAMREAKYAKDRASGPTRREAAAGETKPPVAPGSAGSTPKKGAASKRPAAAATAVPEGERCGHKSMNGRACTREAGHSEKSHRYS